MLDFDFGISKVRSASIKLMRTSTIMGTPNYMSPEQADVNIEEIYESTERALLKCQRLRDGAGECGNRDRLGCALWRPTDRASTHSHFPEDSDVPARWGRAGQCLRDT